MPRKKMCSTCKKRGLFSTQRVVRMMISIFPMAYSASGGGKGNNQAQNRQMIILMEEMIRASARMLSGECQFCAIDAAKRELIDEMKLNVRPEPRITQGWADA